MKKKLFTLLISLAVIGSGHAQLHSAFTVTGGANAGINAGESGIDVFIGWRDCQTYMTSAYNWNYLDGLIQTVQTNLPGVVPFVTMKCTNPITANDTIPGTCANNFTYGNNTSDMNSSWFPEDTVKWKLFLDALIERYDGDGTQDMPGLLQPITEWRIGGEWTNSWCCPYANNSDTTLVKIQDYVKYERMTYNEIKSQQVNSKLSATAIAMPAGDAFYDGYFNQASLCYSNDCIPANQVQLTHSMLAASPSFIANHRNNLYLIRNAKYDQQDLHLYGSWNHIPEIVKWAKDSSLQNKPIVFYEGGGPLCRACEPIYHPVSDTTGILPPQLLRDNASYVVYYYITGIASGVKHLNWNLTPEYDYWGSTWGDLDLFSINMVPKPSAYTYRFLAKDIFSNANADTVIKVAETNPALYHYQINPMGMDVIWSTNASITYTITGTGTLYRWDIPTACDSVFPTACDSVIQFSSMNVSGSTIISLIDGVPVFYSWNNVLTASEYVTPANNYLVKIYPNPFSAQTVLQTDIFLKNATLTIYNSQGQKVKEIKNINGQSVTLTRNNLASGLYFVRLTENSKILAVNKLIITDK